MNVIHFTRLSNLQSILQHGILSRNDLLRSDASLDPTTSDFDRLDGADDAVSVSVSSYYPSMFEAKRHRSGDNSWVILGLNPSLFWELKCHFFAHSIVSNHTKYERGIRRRSSGYAFESLFKDYRVSNDENEPWFREAIGLPLSFPTYPESEVQVFEPIHSDYLKGVWVETAEDGEYGKSVLDAFGRDDCELFVDGFVPRFTHKMQRWG